MDKKNKEHIHLFESDITFTGKHATYIKFLKDDAGIFATLMDAFLTAVVLGFKHGEREPREPETDRARIMAEVVMKKRADCLFLYHMITLLDDVGITAEERFERAFRYEAMMDHVEDVKDSLERFHAYARGGISYMYNTLTEGCTSPEDYINKSFQFAKDYQEEIEYNSNDEAYKIKLAEDVQSVLRR